jgi:hypothetical protein
MNHTQSRNVEIISLESASSFLKALVPELDRIQTLDHINPLVYRGHYDSDWLLMPAALRKDGKDKLRPLCDLLRPKVRDQIKEYGKVPPEHLQENFIEIIAEVYAVRQFCDLADELGLIIPNAGDVSDLDDLMWRVIMRADSQRRISQPSELFVDLPFTFAQHHGIPTRYLDGTRDPYAAAFFATETPSVTDFRPDSPDICVWAVDRSTAEAKNLDWVSVPRGQHGYVHAQSGISLFYGNRHTNAAFSGPPHIPLKKYTLPRTEVDPLRQLLFVIHRTSKAHLMPTLDNIASLTIQNWGWNSSDRK